MSQPHPLDAYRSMIDEGVDDGEIAKMADTTVTEVRKYKARRKTELEAAAKAAAAKAAAAKAAEAPPAAPDASEAQAAPQVPTAPDAPMAAYIGAPPVVVPAVRVPRPGGAVALARELVMKHPGKLVVRLTQGFNVEITSPRTGKPATHPVLKSDYKDGMAVHIVRLAVDHDHTDCLVFMDPASPEYPPTPA